MLILLESAVVTFTNFAVIFGSGHSLKGNVDICHVLFSFGATQTICATAEGLLIISRCVFPTGKLTPQGHYVLISEIDLRNFLFSPERVSPVHPSASYLSVFLVRFVNGVFFPC